MHYKYPSMFARAHGRICICICYRYHAGR